MSSKLTVTILAAMILAGTAWAEVVTNESYPVNWLTAIPCTGDLVAAEGRMHVLFAVTIDANGGLHVKTQSQPQGLHGEVVSGPNLGAQYNGVGGTKDQLNVKPEGYPYAYTYVNNYRWIGKGQAANYQVHETYHMTVNANGEVTAAFDHVEITCD